MSFTKTLITAVCFSVISMPAMEEQQLLNELEDESKEGRYLVSIDAKNDGRSNDYAYVRNPDNRLVKETYPDTHYSFEKVQTSDDICKNYRITHRPLLMQLVVQADQSPKDKGALQELLQKIKDLTIDITTSQVLLTEKDWKYRLLSYIMCGQQYSMVNNKQVILWYLRFETDQDCAHNNKKSAERVVSGVDCLVDYDFTLDREHHAKIVAEFAELLKKS